MQLRQASRQLLFLMAEAKANIDVSVANVALTDVKIGFTPVKTDYSLNGPFSSTGISVEAVYSDGTNKET